MNIAILMGRKGSTGFPGKNTHPVLGRPMCEYPILASKHARKVDMLFISTDDEDIMRIGEKYGANIIVRPPELATKDALGEHVYLHAYEEIRTKYIKHEPVDIIVLLMCNAATITASTIDCGIEILQKDVALDSAVTVSCYNMWSPLRARKLDEAGLLQPFVPFQTFGDPNTLSCDRDSQGDVWFADMSVSVIRAENLTNLERGMLPQKWMGQKIYPLRQWGGGDVDYEFQVPGVEFWLKKQGFTESVTPYE